MAAHPSASMRRQLGRTFESNKADAEESRKRIAQQTKIFLARGGSIEKIPDGESGFIYKNGKARGSNDLTISHTRLNYRSERSRERSEVQAAVASRNATRSLAAAQQRQTDE